MNINIPIFDNDTYIFTIKDIEENGDTFPYWGYINEQQFLGIAKAYAKHIQEKGWNWYLSKTIEWFNKIENQEDVRLKMDHHIVCDITLKMAQVGACCKCDNKKEIIENYRKNIDAKR